MVTTLVIVSRRRPDLYAYISREFFTDTRYHIIFDRRRGPRRRAARPPELERRRGERRARPEIDDEIRVQGWAVAQVTDNPVSESSSIRGL